MAVALDGSLGERLELGVVGVVDTGGAVLGWPASGLLLLQAVSSAAQRQARVRAVACLLRVVTVVTSP
jgi:hypothetical protein